MARKPSEDASFVCGLTSGGASAVIFNPYDRALFLSLRDRRPFLSWDNFKRPYQGFAQGIVGRVVSTGLYFPLEHSFRKHLQMQPGPTANFVAGALAGAVNGVLLNPLSAVKFSTWGRDDAQRTFLTESREMFLRGGLRPFGNALLPSVLRDVTFGAIFTTLRHLKPEDTGERTEATVGFNLFAAGTATVISGPLNLARNLQFATPPDKIKPTIRQVLREMQREMRGMSPLQRLEHMQMRMRVGWGTMRVALGMTFGAGLYDYCTQKHAEFQN
jgi:hypothetical protein